MNKKTSLVGELSGLLTEPGTTYSFIGTRSTSVETHETLLSGKVLPYTTQLEKITSHERLKADLSKLFNFGGSRNANCLLSTIGLVKRSIDDVSPTPDQPLRVLYIGDVLENCRTAFDSDPSKDPLAYLNDQVANYKCPTTLPSNIQVTFWKLAPLRPGNTPSNAYLEEFWRTIFQRCIGEGKYFRFDFKDLATQKSDSG
jgi:hypothetical protein